MRLNATKCITLHAIRLHCLDCINCKAEYTADQIRALTLDNVKKMRTDFLDTTFSDKDTTGLGEISVPKVASNKWIDFKSAFIESLGRTIGKNKIPFTYLIRTNEINDFSLPYDNRVDRLMIVSLLVLDQPTRWTISTCIPSLCNILKTQKDTLSFKPTCEAVTDANHG